jgi:hypothetical protein
MSRSILARGGVFVVLACGLAAGCGGGTNRISGKVTFKGQPIPAGKITFTPDGSKGNTGPTGYAKIVNGEYDTSAPGGLGAINGPMIVFIEGFDPSAKPDENTPEGEEAGAKPLFPRYETAYDVPGSASTKDFDVPADAAKPKPKTKGVLIP